MSDRSFVEASGHLRASLAALRRQTDLTLTFGGTVDRNKRLTLTEFAAPVRGPLRGAVLDQGRGLSGRAVVTGRPLAVADYLATGGISHHYDPIIEAENLRAIVAVPVVMGHVVRAVMYGAVHDPLPLGERIIWFCSRFPTAPVRERGPHPLIRRGACSSVLTAPCSGRTASR
jgi:hypothetical protein